MRLRMTAHNRMRRMTRPLPLLVVFCAVVFTAFSPTLVQANNRRTTQRDTFARDTLLRRFDRNRDGKLDANERSALRAAFGGIDVPMLPASPYDDTKRERPSYVRATELREIDNTSAKNPLTNAGAALGRVLFFDKHLSKNNTVACASCHVQKAGFSDPRRFSIGFAGKRTGRNSMGLANIRYTNLKGERPGFFWDERAASLEAQVLMPIQDEIEMGMKLKDLEAKLQKLPYYPPLFAAAFGSTKITSERIGKAVAQFMRAMVSFDSTFDRAAALAKTSDLSVDFASFTAHQNLGKSLFFQGLGGVAEFACAMCHVPPTFNMQKSFNIGLDLQGKDPGLGALERKTNDPFTPSNHGKFKSPSLRNIAVMAPYMHDGRFKTLEQVVEHYSSGVHPHKNLGLAVEPDKSGKPTSGFGFSKKETAALVAFLKTLTDETFLTDPRFSDPFVRADMPKKPKRQATKSPAERFKALVEQYEQEGRSRGLARKFLQLAGDVPKDPIAVDALLWVATNIPTGAELLQALETLSMQHLKDPKLAALCRRLVRKPSTVTETLLRNLLKRSPHASVKAQACFYLAAYLQRQIQQIETLNEDPKQARRLDQYYGKGFSKQLLSLKPKTISTEIEQLYERTIKSFADAKVGETTMGIVAKQTLFAIRHLSLGKTVPALSGKDVDGKSFKLSDYRGKIVLLDFWGDW